MKHICKTIGHIVLAILIAVPLVWFVKESYDNAKEKAELEKDIKEWKAHPRKPAPAQEAEPTDEGDAEPWDGMTINLPEEKPQEADTVKQEEPVSEEESPIMTEELPEPTEDITPATAPEAPSQPETPAETIITEENN